MAVHLRMCSQQGLRLHGGANSKRGSGVCVGTRSRPWWTPQLYSGRFNRHKMCILDSMKSCRCHQRGYLRPQHEGMPLAVGGGAPALTWRGETRGFGVPPLALEDRDALLTPGFSRMQLKLKYNFEVLWFFFLLRFLTRLLNTKIVLRNYLLLENLKKEKDYFPLKDLEIWFLYFLEYILSIPFIS